MGSFEGLNEETIFVQLKKINQEQFNLITAELPLLAINFSFIN